MAHYKLVFAAFFSLFFTIIFVSSIFHHTNGYKLIYSNVNYPSDHINEEDWREFEEFREWRKAKHEFTNHNNDESWNNNDERISDSFNNNPMIKTKNNLVDPPPSDHPALVGRYVVNQALWTSVATISTHENILSYPFVNVVAVSDGPLGNGTGVPYIYLTPLDFTAKDTKVDSRVTFMMTLAQGLYCQRESMDPIDPRCARIILSGLIKKIPTSNAEYETAKSFIFNRHPQLTNMPTDHKFYFGKLKIAFIAVLDTFGGAKIISHDDYFNPPGLHQTFMFSDKQNKSKILHERNIYRV